MKNHHYCYISANDTECCGKVVKANASLGTSWVRTLSLVIRSTDSFLPKYLSVPPGKCRAFSLKRLTTAFCRITYNKTKNAEGFPQFSQIFN